MSGYELFMKECTSAAIQHGKEARSPSESGGFSCRCLKLGDDLDWENFIGHFKPEPPPEPFPPGTRCPLCTGDTPSAYTYTVHGFTGEAAAYNGAVVTPQTSSCVWRKDTPSTTWETSRMEFNWDHAVIEISAPFAFAAFDNQSAPDDCYESRLLNWVAGMGVFAGQSESTVHLSSSA